MQPMVCDRRKTMSEYDLHSFILACDFRVADIEQMWSWLEKHADGLRAIGARHVVLYKSIWEPARILATIGIKTLGSIRDVLRSPQIFEWFNISGAVPARSRRRCRRRRDGHRR
jgi:hypothetical protein